MQQYLGRGGFSNVSLVQLPGGGWAARKSCPQTPDKLRRMNLELSPHRGRTDHVPNVLWALSTQLDTQQGDISFDREPAACLTLGEYVQNNPLNSISPELVQWVGLHVVWWLGWLHSKRILQGA